MGRWQLRELGFTARMVDSWVEAARLRVLHHGAYALGHRALTKQGWMMAAALACGPLALVSHRSAAWVWNLMPDNRAVVDVTVTGRRRQRPRIVVHQARGLDAADRAVVERIPVTGLPRTLLDLAASARRSDLAKAIEAAERQGTFAAAAVAELIERSRGHHGLKALRAALAAATDAPAVERSELERRFRELCVRAAVPRPSQNVWLLGYEVDALWPAERVVVELDGYEHHKTRAAFERDRRRDADLQAAGYRVVRITWRMLVEEPERVVWILTELLRPAAARACGRAPTGTPPALRRS